MEIIFLARGHLPPQSCRTAQGHKWKALKERKSLKAALNDTEKYLRAGRQGFFYTTVIKINSNILIKCELRLFFLQLKICRPSMMTHQKWSYSQKKVKITSHKEFCCENTDFMANPWLKTPGIPHFLQLKIQWSSKNYTGNQSEARTTNKIHVYEPSQMEKLYFSGKVFFYNIFRHSLLYI